MSEWRCFDRRSTQTDSPLVLQLSQFPLQYQKLLLAVVLPSSKTSKEKEIREQLGYSVRLTCTERNNQSNPPDITTISQLPIQWMDIQCLEQQETEKKDVLESFMITETGIDPRVSTTILWANVGFDPSAQVDARLVQLLPCNRFRTYQWSLCFDTNDKKIESAQVFLFGSVCFGPSHIQNDKSDCDPYIFNQTGDQNGWRFELTSGAKLALVQDAKAMQERQQRLVQALQRKASSNTSVMGTVKSSWESQVQSLDPLQRHDNNKEQQQEHEGTNLLKIQTSKQSTTIFLSSSPSILETGEALVQRCFEAFCAANQAPKILLQEKM